MFRKNVEYRRKEIQRWLEKEDKLQYDGAGDNNVSSENMGMETAKRNKKSERKIHKKGMLKLEREMPTYLFLKDTEENRLEIIAGKRKMWKTS